MPNKMLDDVREFLANAKKLAEGGLTVAEFGELLVSLLRLTVKLADGYEVSGEQKKAWVLEIVGVFFDGVADGLIPVYAKPVWVMLRPAAKSLVLSLASGAIESILPLVREGK